MQDETNVRLYIFSICKTPEEITEAVGIPCDKFWRIGDKRGKSIIKQKENGWALNSGLPNSASLEEHIKKLLERLSPYKEKIRMFAQHEDVQFSCIIYTATRPPLYFSKKVIQQINYLEASLDIDLYIVPNEATNAGGMPT